MKTYWVDLTLAVSAMHEESADNKLDSFLSALDLKKNGKMELIEMGDLYEEGESATSKKGKKAKKVEQDEDWEDEWEDLDWDDLEEESQDEDSEEDSESISFPREVLWETIDRIAKEFAATRLKRGKDDE